MDARIAVRSDTQVTTQVVDAVEAPPPTSPPVLRLRLKKPKTDRKVVWREGTVDNEHMNKKKSKCCCIYKKPTTFGESSSDDDGECEHCFGHPEARKKNKKKRAHGDGSGGFDSDEHDHQDSGNEADDCQGATGPSGSQ